MSTLRMNATSPIVNVMSAAIAKATSSLIRDFVELQHLTNPKKTPETFIANAQERVERILSTELEKAKPEISCWVYGQAQERPQNDNIWIIKCIDGIENFSQGIAHFATTVTLEQKGKAVATVLYNPILDELFWAEKGKGAFMNKNRLRAANKKQLDLGLLGIKGINRNQTLSQNQQSIFKNLYQIYNVRQLGSTGLDLAFIAAGRLDGYVGFNCDMWDVAGSTLLIQEAGGYITDFNGANDFDYNSSIIAGNDYIHKELIKFTSSS